MLKDKLTRLNDNVQAHTVVVSHDINQEAIENMFTLSFSPEELCDLEKDAVVKCLNDCRQLISKKWEVPFVFYCWYDDMAGQIRFSSVSKMHGSLPFKCSIKQENCIERIVDELFRYLDPEYFNPNIETLSIFVSD